jgi:alkaline phosphatase
MGWRGTLRTLGAMAREAERNAQRRQRAHQRHLVALNKAHQLEQAAQAVRDYQEHLERLVSIHKTGTQPIDWDEDARAQVPPRPPESHLRTFTAQKLRDSYQPSWIALLVGFDKRKRKALEAALVGARNADADENRRKHEEFERELAEHHKHRHLAERVSAFDLGSRSSGP